MNEFEICIDMSNKDPAESFNTFSGLTANQEHIRSMPEQKNKIKEFIQWVKDQFRLVIDPTTPPLPQADTA